MIVRTIHVTALALAMGFAMTGMAASHEAAKGTNGGALIDVEGHHVEFVLSSGELTFYLIDEKEAPLSVAGARMKAIVLDGGKTMHLDLSPKEPNKLTATIPAALGSGAKVVVNGTLADGHILQGRFVVP